MSRNFFLENYKKCWKFFKEFKNYALFSLILLVLFGMFGFIFPIFFKQEIMSFIENTLKEISDKNLFELILFIFLNNLKSAFIAIFFGIIFGLVPLINCIINGYILGFVAKKAVLEGGILVLWRLLPHGIFELPAIILSLGIGLKLGVLTLKRNKWKIIKSKLFEALRFFISVILPLLIIAAIIEGILIFVLK
jgi:stage II sporulation protein M